MNKDNKNTDKKLHISDVMFSFSDIIRFSKWLLSLDNMDNQNRYFYI